jgi:hypothetical protein
MSHPIGRCVGQLVCGMAILLAAQACSSPDVAVAPPDKRPSFLVDCTDEGPPQPDCPVTFSPEEDTSYIATRSGPADGTEPVWSGESAESFPGPYFCPQRYPAPIVKAYIYEYAEHAWFATLGDATLIRVTGRTVLGQPMADYQLPYEDMLSIRPWHKYTLLSSLGATIKVVCSARRVRTGLGWRVELGPMTNYGLVGSIVLTNPYSSGGGGSRGWSYGSGGVFVNGAGVDAQLAAQRYIEHGDCTVGYEIWEDGAMVCDAGGMPTST